MVYKLCHFWASAFFLLTAIRYQQSGELPSPGPQIFVSNHISYLDIPMMMHAMKNCPVRILGKSEMGNIPVFGFIYKMGAVSVNRKNNRERSKSVKELIWFLNKGISIFICPEGTFNLTHQPLKSFYDGAFRIAIETQKPIQPMIFPDTYDRLGYATIFSLTPGKSRCIFLDAIPTDGLTEEDVPGLKEKIYDIMAQGLKHAGANWITSPPSAPEV